MPGVTIKRDSTVMEAAAIHSEMSSSIVLPHCLRGLLCLFRLPVYLKVAIKQILFTNNNNNNNNNNNRAY